MLRDYYFEHTWRAQDSRDRDYRHDSHSKDPDKRGDEDPHGAARGILTAALLGVALWIPILLFLFL